MPGKGRDPSGNPKTLARKMPGDPDATNTPGVPAELTSAIPEELIEALIDALEGSPDPAAEWAVIKAGVERRLPQQAGRSHPARRQPDPRGQSTGGMMPTRPDAQPQA